MSELLRENTTRPERCPASKGYVRLHEPLRGRQARCELFVPHDGPHKTYISGVGWHAWEASA